MAALFGESAIARIERAIPGLMAEAGVPGLSLALVEDAAPVCRDITAALMGPHYA